ncbi:MAG: apolipoprotein N-acyltransferase [Ignavibacteria bacterium]|nr:apolipoprotein N-acyltransferase [Ignavibacteria bacterium]
MKIFQRIPKTPTEKKLLRQDRLLLIASGFLLACGFPPIPFPATLFFGLVPFIFVIERRKTLIEINRAVYLMTFTFSIFGLYWVGGFTEMKDIYLMIGGGLLFFINPMIYLLSGSMYYFVRKHVSKLAALLCFPFFWVSHEYLYTVTDWNFPWLNLGNGVCNFTHYIQIADIIGALGLSLLLVSINVALYLALVYRKVPKKLNLSLLVIIAALVVPLIYGYLRLQPEKNTRVLKTAVVQPNLDPYDKWAGYSTKEIVTGYLSQSRALLTSKPDILLWPETALPVYLLAEPSAAYRDSINRFILENKIPLLTGMPDIRYFAESDPLRPSDAKFAKAARYYYTTYNAIYLIQPGTPEIQKYGKSKLVPFGEHVPFVDQIPMLGDLMRWGVGISGWNVGKDTATFKLYLNSDTVQIAGAVCYESIFGKVLADMVNRGAQLLIVVTNDSWYGNTSGPYQHRDFAKLRAVETHRDVVRCANGGISCIIDHHGRLGAQTNMYEKTTIILPAHLNSSKTFYVQWSNLIPFSALTVSCVALLVALFLKLKHRKSAR